MRRKLWAITILMFFASKTMEQNKLTPMRKNKLAQNKIIDSMLRFSVPVDTLFAHEKMALENPDYKTKYKIEQLVYPGIEGKYSMYSTSNNTKTKEILLNLSNISALEFLLELRGIDGWIRFPDGLLPSDLITKDELPLLFKLSTTNVPIPAFGQMRPPPFSPTIY